MGLRLGEAAEAVEALVSTTGPALGGANSGGYSDPVSTASSPGATRRWSRRSGVEALQRALARVADQRPVLPLLLQTEAIAVSRRIDWAPGRGLRIRVEDMRLAQPVR
ncbi:MAG: hypothetical protein IPN83_20850 [Holophagales bacterium]|nr:hypothetical protein [Holophagales bacterium]